MATVHDPQDVTLGGASLSGVLEIRYGLTVEPFRDPAQAQTAAGAGGTLTARLKGLALATDKTLTIYGVRVLAEEGHVSRTHQAACLVRFAAARGDGTDPVTLA
ncbi:MAG: hypothetical protein NT031_11175 [Planctomycetota bacterium]|nr:hypothetical protein [Planctomycetota bacterium]